MAWDDKLQKGKFREVEFFTNSVDNEIGRRTVMHEYPLKDKPYAEDLGKKAREFTVECFVLGDEYMAERDNLIKALEKKGTGTLVHPYWGAQNVQVLSVRIRESSDEGRLARFSIVFSEAGENITPAEDADTKSILNQKIETGILATINDFTAQFGVKALPEFVSLDAVSLVDTALDTISFGQSAIAAVETLRANAATAINNPFQLAQDITGAISQNAGIEALTKLHTFGSSLATVAQISPSTIALNKNRTAMINLIRTSGVLETARQLV